MKMASERIKIGESLEERQKSDTFLETERQQRANTQAETEKERDEKAEGEYQQKHKMLMTDRVKHRAKFHGNTTPVK